MSFFNKIEKIFLSLFVLFIFSFVGILNAKLPNGDVDSLGGGFNSAMSAAAFNSGYGKALKIREERKLKEELRKQKVELEKELKRIKEYKESRVEKTKACNEKIVELNARIARNKLDETQLDGNIDGVNRLFEQSKEDLIASVGTSQGSPSQAGQFAVDSDGRVLLGPDGKTVVPTETAGERKRRIQNGIWEDKKKWEKERASIIEKKKQFGEEIKALEKEKVDELTEEERQHKEEDLKDELGRVNDVLNGNAGDIFLRGMAGKDWKMVEDVTVGNNVLKGFKSGVMLRSSLSLGDAIGITIEKYVRTVFGGGLGKIEDIFTFFFRAIFHSSCKPFTIQEIKYWKTLLATDLMEIDKMIKNADKYDSRGKAEILRDYDDDEQESDDQKQTLNLWQDFIEDMVATCSDLAEEIKLREGYYKKKQTGFGVTSCTRSLRNKLLKLQNWLLQAQSLKDFANTPEAKSIIPAMKKSLDNYFDNLSQQIKPIDPKAKIGLGGNAANTRRDRWDNGMDDEDNYPGFMN